jgi:ParB family transcriptional regulator, chromosome partitioning protein
MAAKDLAMSDKQISMEELLRLPIDDLMPDPSQPRKTFLAEDISRLAASVAARGILQPLRVLFDEERKKYRIIIGESRWYAARLAGLTMLPCLPVQGQPSETDILTDQIVENSLRNSLRPTELARALSKLKALKKCTAQQLATELGLSGGSISKAEALLSLPEDIQALVDDGSVSSKAAYQISRLPDVRGQRELAQEVAAGKVSPEAAAEAVQAVIGKKKVTPKGGRLSCKLDGGISVTISAGQPLTKAELQAAAAWLRTEIKKLDDGEAASLARAS